MDRAWFRAHLSAVLVLIAGLLTLAGCGGGGGDSGSGSGSGGGGGQSLIFSLDKNSVTFNFQQGAPPPPQIVNVTATGQYSGTLYLSGQITGTGVIPPIQITVSGTSATVQLNADPGLKAGTYTGQVELMACSDSACTHQVGNSPQYISYTVNVTSPPKPLVVSPSPVTVSAVSGLPATQLVTVQLPDGQITFSAVVQSSSPWLTITSPTATSFTISLASLPSGSYTGFVLVTSGTASQVINVTYTVTAPAGGDKFLAATPASLTLAAVEDASASTSLSVTLPSWNPQVTATVEYPSGGKSGWLTLSANSGGQQVVADAGQLSAGSYTANVRLHGTYPSQDVVVPVAFTVGVGMMRPADVPVTVTAETTSSALSGSVPINVVSGPATAWSATSDATWLLLTRSSGQTGESLTYTIDQARLGALPNAATSTAHVSITPSVSTMTPVAFQVILNKNIAEVKTLAPYVQLTGQQARVILRGSGFNSVTSLTSRLSIQGGTVHSLSLVNDTEVVAQFDPLSAGTHTVSISNALGLTTSTSSVTAVSAPSYAYAAIATNGALRSVVYDPERDSIYSANVDAESVMSFHHSGSSWTTSSAAFAKSYDVGLTQDGTGLWQASNADTAGSVMRLLDPATLTPKQTMTLPTVGLAPTFLSLGFGIQTTNDGRAWLGVDSILGSIVDIWGGMAYITPQSLTPTAFSPPASLSTEFYGGPWYAMSRDGERLIIVQSSSISSDPPMLYMNAADSVVHANPAGLSFSYYFSMSETGNRVLFDNLELRDGSFNLIGRVTLPTASPPSQSYWARYGLVSLDGSRVYILSYRNDATSQPTVTPRVFVFDASAATTPPNLDALGYFDIPDYPDCPMTGNSSACPGTVTGAVSLDGRTLFIGGNQKLLVIPVPSTLSQIMSVPGGPSTKAAIYRTSATPWPLNLH